MWLFIKYSFIVWLFIPCQPPFSEWEYSTGAHPIPPSPHLHAVVAHGRAMTAPLTTFVISGKKCCEYTTPGKALEVCCWDSGLGVGDVVTQDGQPRSLIRWHLSRTETNKTIKPSTFVRVYLLFLLPSQEGALFKGHNKCQSVSAGARDSESGSNWGVSGKWGTGPCNPF